MWPFKKKERNESPEEIAAEERLDEETRDVAWEEFDKEAAREAALGPFSPLGITGLMEGRLESERDLAEEHGVHEPEKKD
jgi:hypothetical protein